MWIERTAQVCMWTITIGVVLFLLAPLAVTVAVSFSASPVFNLPPPAWSWRWYVALLSQDGLLPALRLSVETRCSRR